MKRVLWPGFYNGGHIWGLDTKNLKQQYQVDSMNDVFLKLARVEAPPPTAARTESDECITL
jgi:hypothetical protein